MSDMPTSSSTECPVCPGGDVEVPMFQDYARCPDCKTRWKVEWDGEYDDGWKSSWVAIEEIDD